MIPFRKEEIDRLMRKYAKNPILRDLPPPFPGWENLLDSMLAELNEYMQEEDVELEIVQCKVKWGLLRVYVEWRDSFCMDLIPEPINKIIRKYEDLSKEICKICGSTKQETVIESKITYECMQHYGDRRS